MSIDDLDGPQFCDDYGYCICGNDCMNPEIVAVVQTPAGQIELGPEDFG